MANKKSRSQRAKAKARQAVANPIVRGQQAFHQGDYDAAIAAWNQVDAWKANQATLLLALRMCEGKT